MSADLSKATPTPNGIAERVAGWLENRAEIYESQITDDGVPSRMCRIFTNELHNLARSVRLIPADDPAHDDRAELIAALRETLVVLHEHLGEFDSEGMPECQIDGEEDLCLRCKENGCIQLKMRTARTVLTKVEQKDTGL